MDKIIKYCVCAYEPCHNLFRFRRRTGGSPKKYCSQWCATRPTTVDFICQRVDCGITFTDLPTRSRKYCSRSCSATVTNRSNPKRRPQGFCKRCNDPIPSNYLYCKECGKTRSTWELAEKIERWVAGDAEVASRQGGGLKAWARDHLIILADNKCTECGWCTPNPILGRPILSVDHEDGNWRNNKFDNLKVLCYNCHTLTPTFGNLNRGSESGSRPYAKERRR